MSAKTRPWEGGRSEGKTVWLGLAAIIFGHSHSPHMEHKNGVLFLNPGSAGPRRFTLPVTVARLRVQGAILRARLVELKV
jgi:predicted phosphodiesterase